MGAQNLGLEKKPTIIKIHLFSHLEIFTKGGLQYTIHPNTPKTTKDTDLKRPLLTLEGSPPNKST